jgi:hypothetical protein
VRAQDAERRPVIVTQSLPARQATVTSPRLLLARVIR